MPLHNPLDGPPPEFTFDFSSPEEDLTAIIIVHRDSASYLSMCLQSISITSMGSNYEIIIVDNGSTDKESVDFLEGLPPDIKVIRNSKNLYWPAAANQGVASASKNAKYFVFLHSDVTILHPNWIDHLIGVTESEPCGMVGASTHMYRLGKQDVVFVEEWLVMFTRECFEAIGPWPEELPIIGHSFILTMKAVQEGFKPQAATTPLAHHWRINGFNVNEFEVIVEEAKLKIPKMIRTVQTRSVGPLAR